MTDASLPQYTFYPKPDYFRSLVRDIMATKHGSRIMLTTMNLDPNEAMIHDVITALVAACKRGVKVNLAIDARDFLQLNHVILGPLWYHAEFPSRLGAPYRQRLAVRDMIQGAGGSFAITNQPRRAHSNPFAGRSHIKAAVINDKVYIGGCNLNDPSQTDMMVSWHDAQTADWLFEKLKTMVDIENTLKAFGNKDLIHAVDPRTSLFIDVGIKKQSHIYEEALKFIDEAQDWLVLTCQFFPHGVTADHLVKASKRGVHVRLIYNQSWKHGAHMPMQQAVIWQERMRGRPRHFFVSGIPHRQPYVHAKLIASDKGVMIGSHNYVIEGVRFGTAEIALLRRDSAIGRQALVTMEQALHGE